MYRAYRHKRWRKKDVGVGLLIFLILATVVKVGYGILLRPSLVYTTLANSEIIGTQPQTMQPKMDIRAIQTSLEDVLQQYQEVINSTNKSNKATLVSEVDKLYSIAASDNTNMKAFAVSPYNKQTIDDLTQSSEYLAASLFEIKDSLIYDGDFSAIQFKNSKDDLTLAIKNLELVRQELKN